MTSCTCPEESSWQASTRLSCSSAPPLHVREQLPVGKVSDAYNVLYNVLKPLSQGYSPAERAALFHDTAARVYRLGRR